MDDTAGGYFAAFLGMVLTCLITAVATSAIVGGAWQQDLLNRGIAEYDSKTGNWKYKEQFQEQAPPGCGGSKAKEEEVSAAAD